MTPPAKDQLSKRERQVMEILYERGPLAASNILKAMADPPSNSAVRSILRLLVEKGHVHRRQQGFRYLYAPAVARDRARRSALKDVLKTFFESSPRKAFVELLDLSKSDLDREDWEHLAELVDRARREEGQ